MNRFISSFFIAVFIVFVFSLCFFIPAFSNYGLISSYNPEDSNYLLNIFDSSLLWPTPRIYYNYF